jgi:hypothetical protein
VARDNAVSKQDWTEMLNADGKAEGVNAKNYYRLFRAFAMHHAKHKEDIGKTINPIDNPQEWGAWAVYLKKINFRSPHMQTVGRTSAITSDQEQRELHGYQVPAKFPSDFDAGHDWLTDKSAGDLFISKQTAARKAAAEIERTKPPLNFGYKQIESNPKQVR